MFGRKTQVGNTIFSEISSSPALYELLAASPPSKSIETEGRTVVVVIIIIIVGDIKSIPSRGTRARTLPGSEAKAAKRIWSVVVFFARVFSVCKVDKIVLSSFLSLFIFVR